MNSLLHNCRIVEDRKLVKKNILIEDGKIKKTGKEIDVDHGQKIDLNGNTVIPGVIDPHVHFRAPGAEYKENWVTGSKAAAKGGVTTVLDMPNNDPPTTNVQRLENKREIARKYSFVNYGFHFGATPRNKEEIKKAENIASVKVYMSGARGNLIINDSNKLYELFSLTKKQGLLTSVHAENNQLVNYFLEKSTSSDPSVHSWIRKNVCAAEASSRTAILSKDIGNDLHICHVSTAEEVEVLQLAGGRVTAEATPHHLLLTEKQLNRIGNFAKVNPPLRTKEDQEELWEALRGGVINMLASDHAPHTKKEKEREYWSAPAGVPGVETLLPLMLKKVSEGTVSLERVVELTSKEPARVFGIQNKGRIQPGYDADLAVIDLDKEWELSDEDIVSKCGWTPFEGMLMKGDVEKTFVNGELVYDNGEFGEEAGKEVSFS